MESPAPLVFLHGGVSRQQPAVRVRMRKDLRSERRRRAHPWGHLIAAPPALLTYPMPRVWPVHHALTRPTRHGIEVFANAGRLARWSRVVEPFKLRRCQPPTAFDRRDGESVERERARLMLGTRWRLHRYQRRQRRRSHGTVSSWCRRIALAMSTSASRWTLIGTCCTSRRATALSTSSVLAPAGCVRSTFFGARAVDSSTSWPDRS